MADPVRCVEVYSIECKNKPGEGARILGALRAGGVNLTAMWGYPVGKTMARIDVAADDAAALKAAAKAAKLKLGKKQVAFHVSGVDRPGVMAEVMESLAAAKINVHAAHGLCAGEGRYGALLQVESKDAKKAAKALGI